MEPIRRLASTLHPYLAVLFPDDEDPNARKASRVRIYEEIVPDIPADRLPAAFRLPNQQDFLYQLTTELAARFGVSPIRRLAQAARSLTTGPRAEELDQILRQLTLLSQRPPLDLDLEDHDWKGPDTLGEGLEKLMGSKPTFLPISFLEVGLERAASVVRIVTPIGIGTGFLTHGDLIVTNHHVLRDAGEAAASKIEFNYQTTRAGLDSPIVEEPLLPADGFATSATDDWTAVRTSAGVNARWSAIDIESNNISKGDFVNIIQHPGGGHKQLALYHSIVTYADQSRVQYLADTLPGSSGSPVFDSAWRLVALHHKGGWLTEPGSKKALYRNQGICVATLLNGLRSYGLY